MKSASTNTGVAPPAKVQEEYGQCGHVHITESKGHVVMKHLVLTQQKVVASGNGARRTGCSGCEGQQCGCSATTDRWCFTAQTNDLCGDAVKELKRWIAGILRLRKAGTSSRSRWALGMPMNPSGGWKVSNSPSSAAGSTRVAVAPRWNRANRCMYRRHAHEINKTIGRFTNALLGQSAGEYTRAFEAQNTTSCLHIRRNDHDQVGVQ